MASDERQDVLLSLLSDIVRTNERASSVSDVLGDVSSQLARSIQPTTGGEESNESTPAVTDTTNATVVLDQDSENSINQLTRQLLELTRVTTAQTDTLDLNTQAVIENSIAAAKGGGSSTGASIGKSVLSFLGGGFGLASLVGKLFGGGGEEPAPTLERYSLPPAVQVDASLSQTPLSGIHPLRYASDGLPRTADGVAASPAAPITIQVQAMDSKSFLDHSNEIANAVREAILNSHSLNDVVLEL